MLTKKYVQMELDYKYNDPTDPNHFYERSDHYNFAKNGVPSVFIFNGVHDYHQKTDTPDKIEYDALTKRAQLAFTMAWELANRENRPVVDKPQI
jgi:Zn-dependent M28 family amino/carboxypeptidase